MSVAGGTPVDRLRLLMGRAAFRGVVTGLSAGIALSLMHQPEWSRVVLAWTCGLLVALPFANVLWVLYDEVRRRDWSFVLLAAAVLALLAYAVVSKLY